MSRNWNCWNGKDKDVFFFHPDNYTNARNYTDAHCRPTQEVGQTKQMTEIKVGENKDRKDDIEYKPVGQEKIICLRSIVTQKG